MKKRIVKIVAATALGFLLAMNIGTSMEFSLGGTEAKAIKALNESPCFGSANKNPFKEYTRCNTCETHDGKGTGTELTC